MGNLLLFTTILAMFLNFSNVAFAKDYNSTQFRKELQTSIKQDKQLLKQSNKELKKAEKESEKIEKRHQQYIQVHHANQKYLQEQKRIQEEREKAQREYERQQQLEELRRNPVLMEQDGRHKKYNAGNSIIFTYDEMTDQEYEEFQRQNRW